MAPTQRKLPVFDININDMRILFATAIAYKSMELDEFLAPDSVDCWNRHIGQAQMLINYLEDNDLFANSFRCVECGHWYPTKHGADACARQNKVDHDAYIDRILEGDSE